MGRVHSDAWVYSQFLPIDAGMATPEQAAQALYYTEWGLERIRLPYGGGGLPALQLGAVEVVRARHVRR